MAQAWLPRVRRRLAEGWSKLCRRWQPRGAVYLFMPINGAGLGHLTRCLAIARQLRARQPEAQIIFVTTSIAVALVQQFGFICHHIPPFKLAALDSRDWNRLLADSLSQLLRLYRPAVLLFDGSAPYVGLRRAMRRHPAVRYLWVRRAGYNSRVDVPGLLDDQRLFDQVLVPAEAGSEPLETFGARAIASVVLLRPDECLTAAEAARELGLEAAWQAGRKLVYVQLGAGNIDPTDALLDGVVSLLAARGFAVVVGLSPIALNPRPPAGALKVISDYPNSRYFALFQFAVLAGGYNSVCEAVAQGLPAIFLPNRHTVADDQLARVQALVAAGPYEVAEGVQAPFEQALERLLPRLAPAVPAPTALFNGAQMAAERLLVMAAGKRGGL